MKTIELNRRQFLKGTGALIVSFNLFPSSQLFGQSTVGPGIDAEIPCKLRVGALLDLLGFLAGLRLARFSFSRRILRDAFAKLSTWDVASLEAALKQVATDLGVKSGLLVHPVRMACTGKAIGPSLYHLLAVLGKERVLQRLDRALARLG